MAEGKGKGKMQLMLSVIVPVYNVEDYIWKFIDSLKCQTFTKWECILVDDCSTDSSRQICELIGKTDERFRIIHNSRNMGLSAARNTGLKEARGNYVLLCDPDDWMAPNMLENTIGMYHDIDMIVCGFNVVRYEDNQEYIVPNTIWSISEPAFVEDRKSIYKEILCKTGTMWNKVIRKEVIQDVKFDENMTYGEDTVFLAKMLCNVKKAVLIPLPLYYYYINRPGNTVSTRNKERDFEFVRNSLQVYRSCCEYADPSYGIIRMMVAVNIVLKKAKEKADMTKKELRLISKVLRTVSIKHQISYFLSYKQGKANIKYLLAAYFPVLYFRRVIRGTLAS